MQICHVRTIRSGNGIREALQCCFCYEAAFVNPDNKQKNHTKRAKNGHNESVRGQHLPRKTSEGM